MIISELHLRIVLSLMKVAEVKYGATFLLNWKELRKECYLFGYDEDVPDAPWVEMKITGGGMGDYYSGSYDYYDVFTLKNLFDKKGQPVWLCYDRMATNIAGDCSMLRTDAGNEQETIALEDIFFDTLNSEMKIPDHYMFLTSRGG